MPLFLAIDLQQVKRRRAMDKSIQLPVSKDVDVEGILNIPVDCRGLVLFAHGSGSSRFSPRNQFVAQSLQQSAIGTLLLDLLSPQEEADYPVRFDIALLTERLALVLDWLKSHSATATLPIGLFGASTGAAAALSLAANKPAEIAAVVSRGGRPDLAMAQLADVAAATLLIVGGNDPVVIDLNRQAYARLKCRKELIVVPGATHLFEETGCLELVAEHATEWFVQHLGDVNVPLQR
jgi:putative phosphoribosyl transferase